MRKQKSARRKTTKQKDKTATLSTKEWLCCGAVLFVFLFSTRSSSRMVNYPQPVYYAVLVGVGAAVGRWFWKADVAAFRAVGKDWVSRGLFTGLHLVKVVVITCLFTGIALLPFNYYNLYRAKTGRVVTESVAIADVDRRTRSGGPGIYFLYNGRRNHLTGNRSLIDSISLRGNAGEYLLVLNMSEGLLGSYVVNDWSIAPK